MAYGPLSGPLTGTLTGPDSAHSAGRPTQAAEKPEAEYEIILFCESGEELTVSQIAELQAAFAKLFCFDARANIFQRLRRIAMMMADGEELDML